MNSKYINLSCLGMWCTDRRDCILGGVMLVCKLELALAIYSGMKSSMKKNFWPRTRSRCLIGFFFVFFLFCHFSICKLRLEIFSFFYNWNIFLFDHLSLRSILSLRGIFKSCRLRNFSSDFRLDSFKSCSRWNILLF